MSAAPALEVDNLDAGYGAGSRAARVLHDVTLSVPTGATMGIVGESGSGKSTLARVLVGQLTPLRGAIRVDGRDVATLGRRELREVRRRTQLIPQDPYASLDPRMPIGRALAEAIAPGSSLRSADPDRITALLETVALDGDAARRRPHEFSGGQRQRIAIARALAVEPRLVIADEVTSALDSSVQAEILTLLLDLQRRQELTLVFITHDLAIAEYMCDTISVLYLGRVAEQGAVDLLRRPAHPYTDLLRASVPDPEGRMFRDAPPPVVAADPGDPADPPRGCPFHPRCPRGPRVDAERDRCVTTRPALTEVGAAPADHLTAHVAACHYPLDAVVPADTAG